MKYIICGPSFDEDTEKLLRGVSPAAGKFLNHLIDALRDQGNQCTKAVYIAYPPYDAGKLSDRITRLRDEDCRGSETDPASDIYVIKDRFILPSVRTFQRAVLRVAEPGDIVLFYNVFYMYWGLSGKLKRRGVRTGLIFADYTSPAAEHGVVRKWMAERSRREIASYDRVISLSGKYLPIEYDESRILWIPGGIWFADFEGIREPVYNGTVNIMYAGLLSPVTGVDTLLRAIRRVKNTNVRFYISGKGSLEEEVRRLAEEDARVIYLGFLSNADYYAKLNDMHIFVNPRNMDLEENRDNFPSKVLEYLATGRVILSTRFSCYEEFCGAMRWTDKESMAHDIDETVREYPDQYRDQYRHNREFAGQYDWSAQAGKIHRFLTDPTVV